MDTGYFLKAFAASPSAVVPGYVLGGISYFSIPWPLGTIVGMASLGLEALPIFATYPGVSNVAADNDQRLDTNPAIAHDRC